MSPLVGWAVCGCACGVAWVLGCLFMADLDRAPQATAGKPGHGWRGGAGGRAHAMGKGAVARGGNGGNGA